MQNTPQPFIMLESGLAEELGVMPLVAGDTTPAPGTPGAPGLLVEIVNAGASGGRLHIHLVNA